MPNAVLQRRPPGKRGDFDLSASQVLLPIIERRRAMRGRLEYGVSPPRQKRADVTAQIVLA